MYGTKSKIDLAFEYQSQISVLRPWNVDDVNVLNDVREKVRQQGRVWWALEASKGANWPKVWFSLSGAAKKKSTVPHSYYDDLTKAVEGKVTPATGQIDLDLPRTFPGHPWLDTPEGHAALRRVLVAYSFRDSDVGYCQGLNYVAALLVLVMKTEEGAFCMLVGKCHGLLLIWKLWNLMFPLLPTSGSFAYFRRAFRAGPAHKHLQ
ncbi:TBC1 domain family member 2A-like protein [Trifolium pratense]|uniref:TBC1 domain family member 2A-like protein n=1 Tax=Trifolium pratense TaxID=57577 RepID=A0A2K3NWW7_TRIPR|nr:TBC1 domain family member 2A-like protein [Trifolium pratense]